jgi:hypothetical protein
MRQQNSTFKVFEFLFQHLEHEALEIFDNWSNHITNQAYFMDLTHELMITFKEGIIMLGMTMSNPNQLNISS